MNTTKCPKCNSVVLPDTVTYEEVCGGMVAKSLIGTCTNGHRVFHGPIRNQSGEELSTMLIDEDLT